jgi:hypothetical protein
MIIHDRQLVSITIVAQTVVNAQYLTAFGATMVSLKSIDNEFRPMLVDLTLGLFNTVSVIESGRIGLLELIQQLARKILTFDAILDLMGQ